MMQTFHELEHKLLNQHHERLMGFSRHLLTLAAGTLALWAGLGIPAQWQDAARWVTALLAVSVLCGLWTHLEDAMEPWRTARRAQSFQADPRPSPQEVIEIRRPPRRRWQVALIAQSASFLLAFALLAVALISG